MYDTFTIEKFCLFIGRNTTASKTGVDDRRNPRDDSWRTDQEVGGLGLNGSTVGS